eukprot:TRINITY_DN6609_c0_g1_i16.p1 TRINITY_DN6609_c0_g1~~TRINITY_DN6609_c0_g1_i16.p1  ORF type:complete len:133 (+),score=53.59 TRINITY_DN6609_c0_g1_i16:157-555(+)
MIRRPPRSTQGVSSAASDVYKRQVSTQSTWDLQAANECIEQLSHELNMAQKALNELKSVPDEDNKTVSKTPKEDDKENARLPAKEDDRKKIVQSIQQKETTKKTLPKEEEILIESEIEEKSRKHHDLSLIHI